MLKEESIVPDVYELKNYLSSSNNKDKEKDVTLNLKSLRAVRVIRPLKLVNGVPS